MKKNIIETKYNIETNADAIRDFYGDKLPENCSTYPQAVIYGFTTYDDGTTAANVYAVPQLWDPARKRISYTNGKTGLPSINLLAGDQFLLPFGSIWTPLKELFPLVTGTCWGNCESCKKCKKKDISTAAEYLEKLRDDLRARGITPRDDTTPEELAQLWNTTPDCYAAKITRNPEPAIKFVLNTIEAKTNPARFIKLVEKELSKNKILYHFGGVVRLHDSGDFFNAEYAREVFNMVRRFKERGANVQFYAYTKAYNVLDEVGGVDAIPENMTILVSPWEALGVGGYEDLPQFIYDDGTNPDAARLPHCPAVDKNGNATGVHCSDCLACPLAKRGTRRAVYAH